MCDCKDWVLGTATIGMLVAVAYAHGTDIPPEYPPWIYCPWCGKKLQKDNQ